MPDGSMPAILTELTGMTESTAMTKDDNQYKDVGMSRIKRVHFIGIGGSGMSGIAEVLINLGYQVSGSDIKESISTQRLKSLGATIYIGHDISNVKDCDVVVYSTAVSDRNPEIYEARKLRIPVVRRAEMLAELMRLKFGLAIAGPYFRSESHRQAFLSDCPALAGEANLHFFDRSVKQSVVTLRHLDRPVHLILPRCHVQVFHAVDNHHTFVVFNVKRINRNGRFNHGDRVVDLKSSRQFI